jgi:hypothetical protein
VETIRDLAVILLAALSLIATLSLVLMVISVWRLVGVLRDEVHPLLRSLAETSETVKGTARFVSETVAKPSARAAGTAVGVLSFVGALWRLVRPRKP